MMVKVSYWWFCFKWGFRREEFKRLLAEAEEQFIRQGEGK